MKRFLTFATMTAMLLILLSCNKQNASQTSSILISQESSPMLTLLQNNWTTSEAVAIPVYGDSSWGWFGNEVFPYSLSFDKNGKSVTYNSIDLTDEQWYDNYAYQLLADDSTLLFYTIINGAQAAHADTAKIAVVNDSLLVLNFINIKQPSVPDVFHR